MYNIGDRLLINVNGTRTSVVVTRINGHKFGGSAKRNGTEDHWFNAKDIVRRTRAAR